jgi:serine/threonine protein kinase
MAEQGPRQVLFCYSHAWASPWTEEAALLSSLRHPCVCQLFGICLAPNGIAVVMELLDCSLHQLLAAPSKHISASLAYRIAHETAQGIAYLHRNTVLHRDIKPGNVVLDQLQHAKVCDFGLSRAFTVSIEPGIMVEGFDMPGSSCCVGTLRYMAPEVVQETEQQVTIRYNEPCDVYSFGMLLWELAHREPPFAGSAGIEVALQIVPAGLRPQLQLPKDLAARQQGQIPPLPWQDSSSGPELGARLAAKGCPTRTSPGHWAPILHSHRCAELAASRIADRSPRLPSRPSVHSSPRAGTWTRPNGRRCPPAASSSSHSSRPWGGGHQTRRRSGTRRCWYRFPEQQSSSSQISAGPIPRRNAPAAIARRHPCWCLMLRRSLLESRSSISCLQRAGGL